MKTQIIKTIFLLLFIQICFLFNACFQSKPKKIVVNPLISRYVSGYTEGMISNKQSIVIELANPFPTIQNAKLPSADSVMVPQNMPEIPATSLSNQNLQTALPDSSVLEDIFEFEPRIKGRAVWVNNRTIQFIPDQILPSNQLYTATFDLQKVATVTKEFETFQFQFNSYPQSLKVEVNGLSTYNDFFTEWQKLSGSVKTSDHADTAFLKKTLEVWLNERKAFINWEYSYNENELYFFVDSIQRKENPGEILVKWDGKPINSADKGESKIKISSIADFTINGVKVKNRDDQFVEINFSDPILATQNLNGLISIKDAEKLTYQINGNIVTVFLSNRLEGSKSISIATSIKNFKGYALKGNYEESLDFEAARPKIKLIGNGCILPNSGGLIFPFEAIALKAVDVRIMKIYANNVQQFLQVNDLNGSDGLSRVGKVLIEKKIDLSTNKNTNLKQWNTHVIDLNKLILPDPGAIYRISLKFNKSYTTCNCETENESEAEFQTNDEDDNKDWNEDNWDRFAFDYDNGYDSWEGYDDEERSACDEYYYSGKGVSRNIIASDIGMIYKLDENKLSHAFISNMLSTEPIANCKVQYFDYVHQLIAEGTTDNAGMLDLYLKQKPFLMIASYGKQKGYMKLLESNANSLSKFDIEGEVVQKGIKGFIYGERGVWRPGDSIYLSFMMEDKEHRLPKGHPVKFELQNPDGAIVYQSSISKNLNGLFDFRTATSADAKTGTYKAIARVGNRMYSSNVKIEMVKPNRLKIYFDINKNPFQKATDTFAILKVKWLHGAIAKALQTDVKANISNAKTVFEQYKDYNFDSPLRTYYANNNMVFEGFLNNEGTAALQANLPIGGNLPGTLRANFITKVFEEGGDFSLNRSTLVYQAFKNYVGIKLPNTQNYDHTFETGKVYRFDVATLNKLGKAIDLLKIQVKVYKLEWRWWYEKEEESMADFISKSGTIAVTDTIIASHQGKAAFNFKINYPDYGRYLVTATDMEGGQQSAEVIYVDWPMWNRANRNNNENASMLSFSSDKTNYTAGENINLSFPSPAVGKALISIESGTKVLRKFWINTQKGETRSNFSASADMCPNAYVHITLLQPHAQTKNDLPIRMYGVVPVIVDDPNTHLKPQLTVAEVWKPESKANIKVQELNGKAMTYTLAIVDEGLLDLTRFKTPQPWASFYAREALGVKTWDMYDAVIGAFAGKLDKMISIGGDGDGLGGKGVKANRFKPMVKFMGPFTIEANQTANHQLEIPNYVGSVRVMCVAQNNCAYGNAEKTVAVRKPLMLLATLPRVIGPAETVYLPVDIFAMEPHIKNVIIEIETNDFFVVEGSKNQKISFDKIGDEVVNFKLKVATKTGIARVKAIATCGREQATQEIEIEVRVANPMVTESQEFVVQAGKSNQANIDFTGIAGTNKAVVEVSNMPPMGLDKRLNELIQYPHGCIEQTVSAAFPQLFVGNLIDLKEADKTRIENHIKRAIKRLQSFQTANGGFAYWPGEVFESEWGSCYAGHFMLEAEKQGYNLPPYMKTKWLKYQQELAKNWTSNNSVFTHAHGNESSENLQAYRLYTLAVANHAELGAMNRFREEKNLCSTAKWRLAAAYKQTGQVEIAVDLVRNLPVQTNAYHELSYTFGSDIRDEAMILEALSLLKNDWPAANLKASVLAKKVAAKLNSDSWLSTQETAYSLLAMCIYGDVKDGKGMQFSYELNDGSVIKPVNFKSICQVQLNEKNALLKNKMILNNAGKAPLYVKVMVCGIPLMGDKTASAQHMKMQVRYTDLLGIEIKPEKLIQGTDFIAEVTLSNSGDKGFLKEMALNQIFASGWEIHNTRMDEYNQEGASARYQDIRDDRVYSYYDLPEKGKQVILIQLNASYLGKFYLPAVYTEAMYEHSIHARIPGRWVEVVKQ